jgi:hypothetical protein
LKINGIALTVFSIFWILILWVEYLAKHPLYARSFAEFGYYGLWFAKLAIYGLVGWAVASIPGLRKYTSGLTLFLWAFLWLIIQLSVYDAKYLSRASVPIEISPGIVSLKVFGLGLLSGLIFLSAYAVGSLINLPIQFKSRPTNNLLSLCVGIMILTVFIFLIGVFGLLNPWVIGGMLILFLGINYRAVFQMIRELLGYNITPKGGKWEVALYFVVLFVLVDIIVFNMVQASTPVPRGFDSLTFYANLPRLIGGEQSLISGFPPHNWSLMMAIGWIVFQSPEISTLLSFAGGVFALRVSYLIGRNYLKLSPTLSLTASSLWYTLPAFITQSSNELKIDLALLFLELLCLMVVLRHRQIEKNGFSLAAAILVGMMLGYLLGVKLTAVYFILALSAMYWWKREEPRIFFGISSIMVGAVIILGLDKISGLSIYHANSIWVGLVLALFGLVMILLQWHGHRNFILRNLKLNLVIGLFAVLAFSPWMVKHAVEAENIDPRVILFGEQGGVKLDMNELDMNYRNRNANPG